MPCFTIYAKRENKVGYGAGEGGLDGEGREAILNG